MRQADTTSQNKCPSFLHLQWAACRSAPGACRCPRGGQHHMPIYRRLAAARALQGQKRKRHRNRRQSCNRAVCKLRKKRCSADGCSVIREPIICSSFKLVDAMQNSVDLFVPGRVCLLGEHSDWAGQLRRYALCGCRPLFLEREKRQMCVATETRHLDRLGQLVELEQESNIDSEQESSTDSHRQM